MANLTNMNTTMVNINPHSDYDHNGAVIYTVVTLVFYSLSLFCSLILNIDPDDHYYDKKWSAYHKSKNKPTFDSTQADILNTLSDQTLRQKYWRIYYGKDNKDWQSNKFKSAESKRLSIVSQRVREMNNEQIKQSSIQEELDELNQIYVRNNPTPNYSDQSGTKSKPKYRRTRSTSVPGIYYPNRLVHSSFDALCETPICKSPLVTLSEH